MTSPIKARAEQIEAVLKSLQGLRYYRDLGANLDPPALLLGPPVLAWEGLCDGGPTSARWVVYVVVTADQLALERLWELVPVVAAAVDELPEVTVTGAVPAAWSAGTSALPSYEITCEVSL